MAVPAAFFRRPRPRATMARAVGATFFHRRHLVPTVGRMVYLNTGWSGPTPLPVLAAMRSYMEEEAAAGPASPEGLTLRMAAQRQARAAAARLVGAEEDEVALLENTTEGINVVVNGLPWQAGDEAVTCSLEHPSILLPLYVLRDRHGVTVRIVPVGADEPDDEVVARFQEALGPRTRLVALSHVSYANGRRLPMREIAAAAHRAGVPVLVDGAQAVGHVAVSVRDLGCDFYAYPGHKWLLGPDGTGALVVRRDWVPRLLWGTVGLKAAHDFDTEGHFTPNRESARRFEISTASGVTLAGFTAAAALAEELDVGAVERWNVALAERLTRGLLALPGVEVVSPARREAMTGLVAFRLPGAEPEAVTAALWTRGRVAARTVGGLGVTRLSLHWFVSQDEVDRTLAVIEDLARNGVPALTEAPPERRAHEEL